MQNFPDGKVPVTDNKASSLLKLARTALTPLYPLSEAEPMTFWLLEHFTGIHKNKLLQEPDVHVNQSAVIHFCNAVEELKKGTPIQYVVGVVDFYKLKLNVNPTVLIPRPETEELVDIIIHENKERTGLRILDIGTGSGCIALSLAAHLIGSTVTAIDISREALTLAIENATFNKIKNVEFLEIDFLEENYFVEKEFDMIVSNPPYIALTEKSTLEKHVADFEPEIALFVPDHDPLVFYKGIAAMAKDHLKPKGMVYVEINEMFAKETLKIFTSDSFSSVILKTDLFGKNRFIKAEKI